MHSVQYSGHDVQYIGHHALWNFLNVHYIGHYGNKILNFFLFFLSILLDIMHRDTKINVLSNFQLISTSSFFLCNKGLIMGRMPIFLRAEGPFTSPPKAAINRPKACSYHRRRRWLTGRRPVHVAAEGGNLRAEGPFTCRRRRITGRGPVQITAKGGD